MTDDGGLRAVAACTTETVRGALETQAATGDVRARFGELLTGTVLYRETMAPTLRVQGILQGANKSGQMVADSHPDGAARGLVRQKTPAKPFELEGALLQMMRSLPNGSLHRGMVEVPKSGKVADALMAYLQASEQVVSMLSVGVRFDADDTVAWAGGYLVQLLPELSEAQLAVMTERLTDFASVEELADTTAAEPETLVSELFYGMGYTVLDTSEVRFECSCSQVRVMSSLATLGRADIESLMSDPSIELSCDYCNKTYQVNSEQLRGLLSGS